ncbi:MAG: tetratricopeptide repeat protein [Candidatus Lokiarchaeota archaeon]|nr:tetratricopeptide repeat protein [Candidatus Lokiarchaeota archaeon]
MSLNELYKEATEKIKDKEYKKAQDLLEEALNISKDKKRNSNLMKIYAELGKCHYFQSNLEKAMENYKRSLRIAEEIENSDYQIKNKYNIALVHQRKSQFKSATSILNEALDLAQKLEDFEKYNTIKTTLDDMVLRDSKILYDSEIAGNDALERENFQDAIQNYQEAVRAAKEIGEYEALHRILIKIAKIYLNKLNQKKLALEYLEEDLSTQLEYGNTPKNIANTEKIIAQLKLQIGQSKDAIKYIEDALEIYNQIKDYSNQLNSYNILTSIHYSLGNKELALEYLSNAEFLIPYVDNLQIKIQIFILRGQILTDLEKFEEAEKNFKDALSISDELMDLSILGKINISMGKLYRIWKRFRLAHDHYSKAINIFNKLESYFDLAISYYGAALVFKEQKEFEKSIEFFNRTLDLGKELNDLNLLQEVYMKLINIYEHKSNIEKQLDLLEKLAEIQNTLGLFEDSNKTYRKIDILRKRK